MADLTALLEREASAEIDAIVSRAREEASLVIARAQEEAEALKAARERGATAQREATLVRAESAARLQAAAITLRAQHEAVEAVFESARERLSELVSDAKAYEPVLTSLLEEAVAALGAESVAKVIVAKGDVALARKIVKAAGLDVSVEAGEVSGGVRVTSGRGSSVENTLESRLESLRDELSAPVAQALFGEDAED